jgi:RNA polymerase sigma-70 factor, ECF subfamily
MSLHPFSRATSPPRAPEGTRPGPASDAELLEALRAGQRNAAGPLYDHLRPAVERALRAVLHGRYRDFDDLVQSTFEHVLRGVATHRFDGRSSLRTWASAIAAHVAIDALRKSGREAKRMESGLPLDEFRSNARSEDLLSARAELRRVQASLGRMNPDQAETLVLHDVLGHPLEEIASLTQTSVSAAQSRLRRARIELARRNSGHVTSGRKA